MNNRVKRKKHDNIVLMKRNISNTIKTLISKDSIYPYISNDEFFSVNNVLNEYVKWKK